MERHPRRHPEGPARAALLLAAACLLQGWMMMRGGHREGSSHDDPVASPGIVKVS